MNTRRYSLAIALGLLMVPVLLPAQDEPIVRGRAAERLEQWRKVRIMEALQLDEETSIRFFARYNKHVQALRDVGQQRNALVDQLQAMARSGASDAEYQKVIEKLLKSEETVAQARAGFLEDIRPILSPKQIGAYIVFERNFKRNVGEVIKEMTQERMERRQIR